MIEEKYLSLSKRPPDFIKPEIFQYIHSHYAEIISLLIHCFRDEVFTDNKIVAIHQLIDLQCDRIEHITNIDMTILVYDDLCKLIDEAIEDCILFEKYEAASNLNKLKSELC